MLKPTEINGLWHTSLGIGSNLTKSHITLVMVFEVKHRDAGST